MFTAKEARQAVEDAGVGIEIAAIEKEIKAEAQKQRRSIIVKNISEPARRKLTQAGYNVNMSDRLSYVIGW